MRRRRGETTPTTQTCPKGICGTGGAATTGTVTTSTGTTTGSCGCGQYLTHTNNFAAAFEDASGKPVGVLASDSGRSSASCPPASPSPINGTTVLYGDCHAIVSSGKQDIASWSFSWTAPPGGADPA